jgi:hypothetical protein
MQTHKMVSNPVRTLALHSSFLIDVINGVTILQNNSADNEPFTIVIIIVIRSTV